MLSIGIGGGGDVVGALATADLARDAGLRAHVGGVSWERRAIDPLPGPRRLDELEGLERLGDYAALAGPDTVGPGPFHFAESHMARFLGEPVALIDPHGGPAGAAAGSPPPRSGWAATPSRSSTSAATCSPTATSPGLASPLCDAILLAAARHLELPCVGVVFGPGCDGELSPGRGARARIAEVAAAGGLLGAWGLTPAETERLEAAVAEVPTEASAQALRCARGEYGTEHDPRRPPQRRALPARRGVVLLRPGGGDRQRRAARRRRRRRPSLEAAEAILAPRGVTSELAVERRVYAGS